MTKASVERLLQYGLSNVLADKAERAGLTASKLRILSQRDLVSKYGLTPLEAKEASGLIKRKPIDPDVLDTLLSRSNYTCNICKGTKGTTFLVHHIEPYELGQCNDYHNLIVLCPNDHDLAHQAGLSLGINPRQLEKAKDAWETQVEVTNADRAACEVRIEGSAVDYVNIPRIEELCIQVLGNIPDTRASHELKTKRILNSEGRFDQKFVRDNLSNGGYLFDYANSGEMIHYRVLLEHLAPHLNLANLDEATRPTPKYAALKALEGRFAFFIGGVSCTSPAYPVLPGAPPLSMRYQRRSLRIEWTLDPTFLMSTSSIMRMGGTTRYIIYCLITSVQKDTGILAKASPLLIALPTAYVNRTPIVSHRNTHALYADHDANEDPDF